MLSANRYTPALKPPLSRTALATMASNTGCTFEGEEAITFRISAAAVCRSSASLVSSRARRSSFLSCAMADLEFPYLGLLTFDAGDFVFNFEALAFGIV